MTDASKVLIIDENEKILLDPYEQLITNSSETFLNALLKLVGYVYSNKGLYNISFGNVVEVKNPATDYNSHIESYYAEHLNEIITANVNALVKEYPTADVQNDNIFAAESVERYARRMDPKYISIQSLARFTYAREITSIGEKHVTIFYDRTLVPLNHIYYMLSILNFCSKNECSAFETLVMLLYSGVGYLKGNNDGGLLFRISGLDFNNIHQKVLDPSLVLTSGYYMNSASFNLKEYTITLPKKVFFLTDEIYHLKSSDFKQWLNSVVKAIRFEKDELLLELDNIANMLSFIYSKGYIELIKRLNNVDITTVSAGVVLEDINTPSKLVCKLRNLLHNFVFNMKRLYAESMFIADARGGQSININSISEKESEINDALFDEILETTEEMNTRIQAEKAAAEAEAKRLADEAEAERNKETENAIAEAKAEIEKEAQAAIDSANALKTEAEKAAREAQEALEKLQEQIAEAERNKQAEEAERLRLEQEEAERKKKEEEEAARLAAEEAERLRLEAEKQKALETEQKIKELEAQLEAERRRIAEEAEMKRLEEERLKQEESERLKKALEEQQKAIEDENAKLKQELEQRKEEQQKKDAEEEERKKKEEEEKEKEKKKEEDEEDEKKKDNSEKSEGMSAGVIILIIILVISALGMGVWFITQQNKAFRNMQTQMQRRNPVQAHQ